MAGYSGTPLVQKLGIKPGCRLALLAPPPGFDKTLGKLPADVKVSPLGRAKGSCDVVVAFFQAEADFRRQLPRLQQAISASGGLWIAWPKKASGIASDMKEDTVRQHALPLGLVDNKVCAIDEVWSGLRLVWRRENRPS